MALIIVGTALGVGLLANWWVRPFADSEVKGIKLEALVGPILLLTVVLIASTLLAVLLSLYVGMIRDMDRPYPGGLPGSGVGSRKASRGDPAAGSAARELFEETDPTRAALTTLPTTL